MTRHYGVWLGDQVRSIWSSETGQVVEIRVDGIDDSGPGKFRVRFLDGSEIELSGEEIEPVAEAV